jgi:hypothetical protein
MFGSEILDIIIGLIFVYFLLSLVCSAINEYIASITNKRGKVLVQGLEELLRGSGIADRFYAHPLVSTVLGEKRVMDDYMAREVYIKKQWFPGFRWIYRLISWVRTRDRDLRHYHLASYLPARIFALALLDAAGYNLPANRRRTDPHGDVSDPAGGAGTEPVRTEAGGGPITGTPSPTTPTATVAPPPTVPDAGRTTSTPAQAEASRWAPMDRAGEGLSDEFRRILDTLQRDSAIDVTEFASLEVAGRLAAGSLPDPMKRRVSEWFTEGGQEIQKLHDSVEVWFNNKMDRVSGLYKRHTQTMLFVIGLVLSIAVNADTLDLWRRLSTDKALRDGLATNAANTFQLIAKAQADSAAATGAGGVLANGMRIVPPDSASQAHARVLYDTTLAVLNRTQLRLGWSTAEARALGVLAHRTPAERVETVKPAAGTRPTKPVTRLKPEWRVELRPWKWYRTTFWPKLIGLLVTAFALSLGAPFWFDMLNKVVNIRNAGRAPDERAKKPEAPGKRAAELPTK